MKLHVLAFKDNALGCFTQPFYNDVPIENVKVSVTRAILGADAKGRASYKHKVLYKIADFEDTTGLITNCDYELILDCDEIISQFDAYGTKENN